MIDINKKLMLVIVTPSGEVDVNYFDDYPDNLHYKILRNYIHNKSNSFSLQYDLKRADQLCKEEKEKGKQRGEDVSNLKSMEFRLPQLSNVFNKNGYMLLFNMCDYRYDSRSNRIGTVNLPDVLENLSDTHKQIFNEFSKYIEVNKTAFYTNPDKIVFEKLLVYYYDKIKKEQCEIGQYYDVLEVLNKNKDAKRNR